MCKMNKQRLQISREFKNLGFPSEHDPELQEVMFNGPIREKLETLGIEATDVNIGRRIRSSYVTERKPSVADVENSGIFCKYLQNNNIMSKITDAVMNTYTKRRHGPQGQSNITGKRHESQAQHGVVPGRRADGVDQPFPNKPVAHRRPLNPRTQDSVDLYDFEKISITKQSRGPSEQPSNGIKQTTAPQHPRKDPQGLPKGELQMDKAIHAKKLMLQEKLWKVEEKIREKIQRDHIDTATGDEKKNEEQRHHGGNVLTKGRMSEHQRREPVRGREMMMQERRQEDAKQLRKRQDLMNDDRMRKTHEEERARWGRREREVMQIQQLQRKGGNGTHEIKVHRQEVSGELNKSRWENVKKHTRGKGLDERDNRVDGTEKAKDREQNTISMVDKGWTRDKTYREKTCKEMYISDDEQHVLQMSQQKTSHRSATKNHRDAARKLSGEPLLPPVSSPSQSNIPEQGELIDNTNTGPQLLPCRICKRKFASERLEKHVQICKKVKQSHRQVFNSYLHRTKGSAVEEYFKTHTRTKTPELVEKKKLQQNHKANTRNLHEGQLPAGTSERSSATQGRMSEHQRKEPVRGREMVMQERRQEDAKQLRKRQDLMNDDRMSESK